MREGRRVEAVPTIEITNTSKGLSFKLSNKHKGQPIKRLGSHVTTTSTKSEISASQE